MRALPTTAASLALAAVVLAPPAAAEGPQLNPGKWEFESTITTSKMTQPKSANETRCITEEEAKADPLAAIGSLGNCRIVNRKTVGDALEFEVDCSGASELQIDLKMRGRGRFAGQGDTAMGSMDLEFETPGVPDMSEVPSMPQLGGRMTLNQTWRGKRVGDCD